MRGAAVKEWIGAVVLALGAGFLSNLQGAPVHFTVSSFPRAVRSQGITEAVADIIFTASATGTTAAAGVVSIQVQPSIHITNNANAFPFPISVIGLGSPFVTSPSFSGDTLTFTVPGNILFELGSQIRVRGIRVNVSESGVAFPPGITAQVTAAPVDVIALDNSLVTVAIPETAFGIASTMGTSILPASAPLAECSPDRTPSGTGVFNVAVPGVTPPGSATFHVVATEKFSTAFSTAIGFQSGDERSASDASEVTNGTRLVIRVNNLPTGVTLFAPGRVDADLGGVPATSSSLRLTLVKGTDANGAGGTAVTGVEDANTAFSRFFRGPTGSTLIAYQVTLAAANDTETANIPIAVTNAANPALGQATASVALGPISTIGGSNPNEPLVRFVDRLIQGPAFRVVPCRTNLLFPWITNQVGFDTGLAISNTSKDPYGTGPQSGSITLHFFGVNAPPSPITTAPVEAGTTYTAVLSSLAPDFQGYVVAIANFQFAEGLAFLTDGFGQPGGPKTSTSYVAIAIPDPNILGSRLALPALPFP